MRHALLVLSLPVLLVHASIVQAQNPHPDGTSTPLATPKINFVTGSVEGKVPFDVPVLFVGTAPPQAEELAMRVLDQNSCADRDELNSIFLALANGKSEVGEYVWQRQNTLFWDTSGSFALPVPASSGANYFEPDQRYCIAFVAYDSTGTPENTTLVGFSSEATLGDHFTADIGVAYAPEPQALIPTFTATFYLTAINKEADLGGGLTVQRQILQRVGIYLGVSPTIIRSDTPLEIRNATAVGNIVLGLSLRAPLYGPHLGNQGRRARRFLQPMRLNFGILQYKQEDANPLVSDLHAKTAFVFGVSYDLEIQSFIAPLVGLFGVK